MRIYRICDAAWAHEPFSGNGGLYRAGRWRILGTRVAYASPEQGTAMLEVVMNVAREALLVDARALVVATLPDELVAELDPALWPSGWDGDVHSDATRTLGDEWVRSRSSVGLIVPSSAGTPPSFNVLVNPEQPDADRIRIGRTTPFALSARPGAQRS